MFLGAKHIYNEKIDGKSDGRKDERTYSQTVRLSDCCWTDNNMRWQHVLVFTTR